MGTWPPEEASLGEVEVSQPRKHRWSHCTQYVLAAVTITLFITLTTYSILHLSIITNPVSNCGHTAAAARLANCHYKPMLASWIPSECYDPSIRDEYAPYDDRAWFWDYNMTIPMVDADLERKRRGDDITGYTKFFHDEHCLYAWRKLHLAVQQRKRLVDSKTMDLQHSTHCSKRIAKLIYNVGMWGYNETLDHTSRSPVMYQTCVPLPWERGGWWRLGLGGGRA